MSVLLLQDGSVPVAVGTLIGFALGGVLIAIDIWRDRRRKKRKREETP